MRRLTADRPIVGMPSELGQVMAAARAREQAGERVLHLERGEPDFDTPGFIIEALAAAARAGETHYPDSRGTLPLREALVEKLARENGIHCEVDDLVVTVGGTHALFIAFQALLAPGDERLRSSIRPETRGLYLNTPNNPTGAVLARAQLEAIAAVAIERDLWVVSDEAPEPLLFHGTPHL